MACNRPFQYLSLLSKNKSGRLGTYQHEVGLNKIIPPIIKKGEDILLLLDQKIATSNMFRRPLIVMSNKGRTIIRDPRKTKKSRDAQKQRAIVATKANEIEEHSPIVPQSNLDRPRMAFEPSTTNQQSLGLGSYMLAGVGVAVGVTIVSAIFGAVGL